MPRRNLIALIILIAVVVIAAIVFAYRAGQHASKPAVTPQPSPSPTLTTTPKDTSTPAPAVTAQCSTNSLKMAVGPSNGAAGHTYYSLTFTNQGSVACILFGYPGVSLVDGGGDQLGQPATRASNVSSTTITLAAGQVAHATIDLANPGAFDPSQCSATSANLKIYPPDQTQAVLVPLQAKTCGDFTVTAIGAGANSQ